MNSLMLLWNRHSKRTKESSLLQEKLVSILIVDDDRRMRESLRDLLAFYDLHSTLAENGQQALEFLNDKHFDLVLLDIEMPEKNGFQVMSDIDNHHSDTDVIVLSGKASFENARQAFVWAPKIFLINPMIPLSWST